MGSGGDRRAPACTRFSANRGGNSNNLRQSFANDRANDFKALRARISLFSSRRLAFQVFGAKPNGVGRRRHSRKLMQGTSISRRLILHRVRHG